MATANIKIRIDETGRGSLIVNDVEWKDCVTGFYIHAQAYELTQITVNLIGKVDFEGIANVDAFVVEMDPDDCIVWPEPDENSSANEPE